MVNFTSNTYQMKREILTFSNNLKFHFRYIPFSRKISCKIPHKVIG